jgi:UDP-galactopyranose mutase
MPINLHTINQFFAKNFSPQQAKDFIEHIRFKDLRNPKNFEEQALSMLGSDLYEAFLKNYTIKQWGCDPKEIPASVLKRLPLRFNYNDNYYNKKYQGIPTKGYTDLVENILDHKNISVSLGVKFNRTLEDGYEKVFYTGKIDEYFDYCFGHLGYRTVYWEDFIHEGDFQGNPVINYSDRQIPYTRVIEHKHFSPNSNHDKTLISLEYSKETTIEDEPFYPKRLAADIQILEKYQDLISQQIKVVFLGRLATYRYLDMDKVIEEALEQAKVFMNEDVNI